VLSGLWKHGQLFEGAATNQVVMRRHKELCKRLKFDFRLYDFRHTYGSRMAMAGVDLMTLRAHGAFLDHHHAAILPSHTGTQGLCNGAPGSVQHRQSHKKATFGNDGDSVKRRNLLMAEREGFEPSIQVLARITV